MKSKKIISLLCASALSVSAFAGLAMTASAEETVLWSDSFNGYVRPKDDKGEETYLAYGRDGRVPYEGIDGINLQTTNRADDSSYWDVYAKEDNASDKYLQTTTSRFASSGRGSEFWFVDADKKTTTYKPESGKDLVFDFDIMFTDGDTSITYDRGFLLVGKDMLGTNTNLFIDKTAAGVEFDTWADMRVVTTSAGTKVYVNGTEVASSVSMVELAGFKFDGYMGGASVADAQKASTHPAGYPTYSFDNMVVYTAAAGEGATSTAPEAETKGEVEIVYTYAPEGEAPEGMGLVAKDNFNSAAIERLIFIGTEEAVYDSFNSATLKVGPHSEATGDTKWEIVVNPKKAPDVSDNVLKAVNSSRSTANRGPKMQFKYGEIAERETVVVQFATKLVAGSSGPAEVLFSGDFVASESKGNINSPLAMITTDKTAASAAYASDNAIAQDGANVLEVKSEEWVLVTITATRAKDKAATAKIAVTQKPGTEEAVTTYILGDAETFAEMKDSNKKGINTLPCVSFRSGNDTDYGVSQSSNEIDNIAIYSSAVEVVEEPAKVTAELTTADDGTGTLKLTSDKDTKAVVIKASYDANGAIAAAAILKTYTTEAPLTATADEIALTDVMKGDKFFVWESGKKPVAFCEVKIAENGKTVVETTPETTPEA